MPPATVRSDRPEAWGRRPELHMHRGSQHTSRVPAQRVQITSPPHGRYSLAACTIVLTSYERCEYEYTHRTAVEGSRGCGSVSALMRLRWLRLVVDEGHELGHNEAAGWSSRANELIALIAAERRWRMSSPLISYPPLHGSHPHAWQPPFIWQPTL